MGRKLLPIFSKILFQLCFRPIILYVGTRANSSQDASRNVHITSCRMHITFIVSNTN